MTNGSIYVGTGRGRGAQPRPFSKTWRYLYRREFGNLLNIILILNCCASKALRTNSQENDIVDDIKRDDKIFVEEKGKRWNLSERVCPVLP